MADRPLDRYPYYVQHFEHLDRVLSRPQLAGIGISGCIGSGIWLSSGGLISTVGSLGAPLRYKGYLVAGGIVACVFYTITEMVACRPLTGSLIDLPHTFFDPAFGFAVAASYALANICSMATLTAQSSELTALLKDRPGPHKVETEVAINIAFIALTTISHCFGVKFYGRLERVIMWFKLCLGVLICILMVVINTGGAGPRQGSYRGNYTTYAFPPGFKPTGFNNTTEIDLHSSGVPDTQFGLPGPSGRFFGFLTAVSMAMFSCTGGEIVAMTAGESKSPWRDVPAAMSFAYLVPLSLYPFIILSGGANVNYADPNLSKIWSTGKVDITQSPYVVAAQTSALHGLPKALNLFFMISAYTAGNTALYVASRAVFMLAQTYLPKRLADIFGRTNNGHTPLASILLCSALGFLSLVGMSNYAYSQPRITLGEFYTGTMACINICLCITFLRFKAGIDRLAERKILSRDDPLYIKRLFKSRWQPLPAYVGIVGCSCVVVWSGIPALYMLGAKGKLTSSNNIKSSVALAFDVVGVYIGPAIFATFYHFYKYITPGTRRVDLRDLTPSHFILDSLDTLEEEDPNETHHSRKASTVTAVPGSRHPSNAVELDSPVKTHVEQQEIPSPHPEDSMSQFELSPEMQDEIEAQRALHEERSRVNAILKSRPVRMEKGFWRMVWSFIVVEKEANG